MVRTAVTPKTKTVFFNVPEDYVGREPEVIAFTKNKGLQTSAVAIKQVSFAALSIDTQGFKFNRDEANER